MKMVRRIFILLVVAGLIGGTAGLIVKATDPGAATEPVKQSTATADNSKALNREQPAPSGSSQGKTTGSSAFSLNVTLENLGKMTLIVAGVWGIEKSAKNRRRTKRSPAPIPRSEPAWRTAPKLPKTFLPRPRLDFYGKWDREEPAQGD